MIIYPIIPPDKPKDNGLPYIAVTENLPILLDGSEPTQDNPSDIDVVSTTTEPA